MEKTGKTPGKPGEESNRDRVTIPYILSSKGGSLVALTAYDFTIAKLLDRAGVDIILVGDSVGSVVQGHSTTIPVTLDQIIYHSQCVTRGVKGALVVGDLPFMSYQVSPTQALESAGRLIKEGGVSAVKLEGGIPQADTIDRLTAIDIPVMGHVGLTPQSYHRMGGHKIQGKTRGDVKDAGSRKRVLEDAKAVADAGAFAVVLEGIPEDLAAEITDTLPIPTIGIGAGTHCDGQILVINDVLGLDPDFNPRFAKKYLNLGEEIISAVQTYGDEVRTGKFPAAENTFRGVLRQKIKLAKG